MLTAQTTLALVDHPKPPHVHYKGKHTAAVTEPFSAAKSIGILNALDN